MNDWINLHALWKIIVFGLICGAGLPAVFAVGIRAFAMGPKHASVAAEAGGGTATTTDDDSLLGGSSVGMVLGGICFAIFLAGIAWGIYFIVSSS